MAEKEGKTVELLVVPSVDPFEAIVQTAAKLQASRVVRGESLRMDTAELARRIGLAWERLTEPRHPFSLEVLSQDKPPFFVNLGPHPPRSGRRIWTACTFVAAFEPGAVWIEAASSRCDRGGAAAFGARSRGRRAERAGSGGSGFRSSAPLIDWGPTGAAFRIKRGEPNQFLN